jgi:hypothetical protein
MKKIFVTLLLLQTVLCRHESRTFAQTIDPLSFFPYRTGNMWEYFWVEIPLVDTLQTFIVQDSVGSDGRIYVTKQSRWINPIVPVHVHPERVAIDTTLKQVWGDLGFGLGILYKLNAQRGDQWVMSRIVGGYEVCRVVGVEQTILFGRQTTIKRYHYYLTADSTDTTGYSINGLYTLAAGFGLTYFTCPDCWYYISLKGAVIDGVLYGDTTRVITSVSNFSVNVPTQFELSHPYPNPFNPSTTMSFNLPASDRISLVIYDVLGKEVRRLIDNERFDFGPHHVMWNGIANDGRTAPSGTYFCRLSGNGNSITRSMILLK